MRIANGYPISRLEENTVKVKSLISIGLFLMKAELNIGLKFRLFDADRMN